MEKVCLRAGYRKHASARRKKRKGPAKNSKNNSTAFTNVTVDHPAYDEELPGPSRTPTKTDTVSQKKLFGQREKMIFDNETEDENNVLLTGYRFIDLGSSH